MKDKQSGAGAKKKQLVLRLLIILLLSLFLGVTVYLINAKRVMKNLMPMPFGVGSAVVLSGSMEPTLSVNDLVVVRAAEHYSKDDIVVFQSGPELVIHRVVSVENDQLITRGDANDTEDPPISPELVKGRLILVIPYVGLLIRGLQTLPGILIVLALAVFMLRLSWQKEKDASSREQDAIKAEIRLLRDQLAREQADKQAPGEGTENTKENR